MSLPKGAIKKQLNSQDIMKTPFVMFQAHKDDYYNMSQDCLKGIQEESILTKVFFHPKNIDLIQKQIITEIFRRTNGTYLIENQNEIDLQIVMRSIFLTHAKNLLLSENQTVREQIIKEQIRELNNLVTDEVFSGILSEIKSYSGYIERAFGPVQIMDRPENVSNAGLKTLPSVTRTFDSNN